MSNLPKLEFWKARSFWATFLTVLATMFNTAGVDLFAVIGLSQGEVLDAIQYIIPAILAVWAWLERRKPNYQLVASKK